MAGQGRAWRGAECELYAAAGVKKKIRRCGVRALAAGHYVPRALFAAWAAAGVSDGQVLAAERCVRGVPRARYGRPGRRALSMAG